jgi:uncharacterized iron-regulated membrane protein
MTLRKIIFWLHLCCGVFAGIVVLIISATGVALTYEKQMLAWADLRDYRQPPPSADARRLPMGALLEKARAERGGLPSTVTVRPGDDEPVALGYGRETTVYANPYSGAILGEGSRGLRSFFGVMTDWHRWLGAGGANRNIGRAITGACNLAFLFIVVSGLYLWWPRRWRWPNLRSVVWFRGGLRGKARDFNWHNVIGFWSLVPLFFVVLSGTVMSYPWASSLVYRLAGEEPPARSGPGGPGFGPGEAGRARGQGQAGEPGRAEAANQDSGPAGARADRTRADDRPATGTPEAGARRERPRGERGAGGAEGRADGEPRGGPPCFAPPPDDLRLDDFDALFARARQQVSGWQTITLRLPQSDEQPLSFSIDQGSGGQPQLRSTLTLERGTAELAGWETFSDGTRARRLRSWLRFIHTGEAGGLAGQTLAGLASGGAVVLVYTGLALALRRFFAWVGCERRWAREEVLVER